MKRFVIAGVASMFAGTALLVFSAVGQSPPSAEPSKPRLRYETRTHQVPVQVKEIGPDGKEQVRTIFQSETYQVAVPESSGYPSGPNVYAHNPFGNDPQTAKLLADEQGAAQEARKLAAEFASQPEEKKEEARTALRTKLNEVFDLQQKRRAHEMARIEERLTKLKETMKKRDDAKESIVDRRLEVLTGGVDELAWEETGVGPSRTPGTGFLPVPTTIAPGITIPGPAILPGNSTGTIVAPFPAVEPRQPQTAPRRNATPPTGSIPRDEDHDSTSADERPSLELPPTVPGPTAVDEAPAFDPPATAPVPAVPAGPPAVDAAPATF